MSDEWLRGQSSLMPAWKPVLKHGEMQCVFLKSNRGRKPGKRNKTNADVVRSFPRLLLW